MIGVANEHDIDRLRVELWIVWWHLSRAEISKLTLVRVVVDIGDHRGFNIEPDSFALWSHSSGEAASEISCAGTNIDHDVTTPQLQVVHDLIGLLPCITFGALKHLDGLIDVMEAVRMRGPFGRAMRMVVRHLCPRGGHERERGYGEKAGKERAKGKICHRGLLPSGSVSSAVRRYDAHG